jgi:hypothetical protein
MSTALMAPGGEQNIVYFRDGSATPSQRYHNFITTTRSALASPDPKHKASLKGVNDALYRLKEVTPNQVQDNRFLSNVSLQYKNDEYIGELLMPPVPVGQLAGQYPTYDKRSRLAAPDDSMAGRSKSSVKRLATASASDHAAMSRAAPPRLCVAAESSARRVAKNHSAASSRCSSGATTTALAGRCHTTTPTSRPRLARSRASHTSPLPVGTVNA